MGFETFNPATGEKIASFEYFSDKTIDKTLCDSDIAYRKWRDHSILNRCNLMNRLAEVLEENCERFAQTITKEMGKIIRESRAEVMKCALMARTYAENAEKWLEDEIVVADGIEHRVAYRPSGVIFCVMPWNFPFWQALRFAVPSLISGNTSILKHANNVPECAILIEEAFRLAGFPENVFKTVLTDHAGVAKIIESKIVRGVSFTGSTNVGKRIAELAGRNLKKVVLELGGSDPFIVLDDADLDKASEGAVAGRLLNGGQSCIAAKRFIVVESVAEEFTQKFLQVMKSKKEGNPLLEESDIGPLVNEAALLEICEQVDDAISKGAKLLCGGIRKEGLFYPPTLLSNISLDMKVATDEVFGPVAPIIVVKDEDEALEVANSTEFGLGGSVWSEDFSRGSRFAEKIESGSVFLNSFVKSDPRMPFGGVKSSGFGRELSKYGLKEFVNIQGVNLY